MPKRPTYDSIATQLAADNLAIFGGFAPVPEDGLEDAKTVLLLGPLETGFWAHVSAEPEFCDGGSDPMDRWSLRVVTEHAKALGAKPLFPFGGPPYQPFISWATRTGRAWSSPVGLLVHDEAGLMVSYRGALALPVEIDLPPTGPKPCETCSMPCLNACPVGALTSEAYDTAACHRYLDTEPGADCLNNGCAVRRICPVSQRYDRKVAQSAFHMRAFHK